MNACRLSVAGAIKGFLRFLRGWCLCLPIFLSSFLNFQWLQNLVSAIIARFCHECVIAFWEVVRCSKSEQNDYWRQDSAVCDCRDDGKECDCKSDEQAFVCKFVAEVLSHLSLSSVSNGPATLMPVIYSPLVIYSGQARDRFVKRGFYWLQASKCLALPEMWIDCKSW